VSEFPNVNHKNQGSVVDCFPTICKISHDIAASKGAALVCVGHVLVFQREAIVDGNETLAHRLLPPNKIHDYATASLARYGLDELNVAFDVMIGVER